MISSMTGYGSASMSADEAELSVEIKTLNSKYLDLNLKISKEFADKEYDIRKMLTDGLRRGKVNFNLELSRKGQSGHQLLINEDILEEGYQKLKQFMQKRKLPPEAVVDRLLQLPEVLVLQEKEDAVIAWASIKNCVQKAIEQCNEFRNQEGAALEKQLDQNLKAILENLKAIEQRDPVRIEHIKERISANLEEFISKEHIDKNRYEQELIYYIEKLDISEEKTRLHNHLIYFSEVVKSEDMPGKKLGFISQEIGREINTIGSKASDSIIQHHVVQMKEELEKIKEQLLNIV